MCVLITPILSSGEAGCDLKTQYIFKDLKSGKFIECKNVRQCGPGEEPETPSGSVIGIHETVGHCSVCKKGTYSTKKDTEPCKNCKSASCFDHQVVKGSCPINKPDTSYCTDECEVGYVMNNKKTGCEPVHVTTNPTQSTKTETQITSTINNTDKAAEESGDGSQLLLGVIIAGAILIILVLIVVIVAVYYKCWRRTAINSKG